MKCSLEWINSRFEQTGKRTSELEERRIETTKSKEQKGNGMNRNEQRLRDLGDSINYANICIMGVQEGDVRQRESGFLYGFISLLDLRRVVDFQFVTMFFGCY